MDIIKLIEKNDLIELEEYKKIEYDLSKYTKSKNLNSLQLLILYSNQEPVKNFIKNNIHIFKNNINYRNDENWSALMMACANSNTYSNNEIVKLLLENGADPDLENNKLETALIISFNNILSKDSNIETLQLLLENGANIDIENNYYLHILLCACNYSNTDLIKILLEKNSDVNKINKYGTTALLCLCRNLNIAHNIEIIEFLLKKGANPNSYIHGYTPLMTFCRTSMYDSNIKMIKLLLEYGADINMEGTYGENALSLLCENLNLYDNTNTIKLLLDYDANVNIANFKKYNSLMILCKINEDEYEIAKLLLYKTNLNFRNCKNKKIEDICRDEYKKLIKYI